jgi:hypothetical protein
VIPSSPCVSPGRVMISAVLLHPGPSGTRSRPLDAKVGGMGRRSPLGPSRCRHATQQRTPAQSSDDAAPPALVLLPQPPHPPPVAVHTPRRHPPRTLRVTEPSWVRAWRHGPGMPGTACLEGVDGTEPAPGAVVLPVSGPSFHRVARRGPVIRPLRVVEVPGSTPQADRPFFTPNGFSVEQQPHQPAPLTHGSWDSKNQDRGLFLALGGWSQVALILGSRAEWSRAEHYHTSSLQSMRFGALPRPWQGPPQPLSWWDPGPLRAGGSRHFSTAARLG